jgi:hypothetical protein
MEKFVTELGIFLEGLMLELTRVYVHKRELRPMLALLLLLHLRHVLDTAVCAILCQVLPYDALPPCLHNVR